MFGKAKTKSSDNVAPANIKSGPLTAPMSKGSPLTCPPVPNRPMSPGQVGTFDTDYKAKK